MKKLMLLFGAVLLLCALSRAADPAAALLQADRDFCKDVTTRRLEGYKAWLAPNVVTFTFGGQSHKGPDEAGMSMKQAFDDPDYQLTWEVTKAEIFVSGNMGYTTGRFTIRDKAMAGPIVTKGTYITVWEKQKDGSWKVLADGGSTDEPVLEGTKH